jgi:hypothetical protein
LGPAAWRRPASGSGGLLGPAAWQCSRAATWQSRGAAASAPPRRRSSAALLSSFSSSSPPGPFFFLPNQQLGQGHGACGLRLRPAPTRQFRGAATSTLPWAASSPSSPNSSLSPSPPLSSRWTGRSPWGRRRCTGRCCWGGFKRGRRPRVWGERTARIPFRGTRRPSRGASAAGQGRHGWRRPRERRGWPPASRHGGEGRQGKDKEDG